MAHHPGINPNGDPADALEAAAWHMDLARALRDELDALEPDEAQHFDRLETVGDPVRLARLCNHVALRWRRAARERGHQLPLL